jgi:hypothetical protein
MSDVRIKYRGSVEHAGLFADELRAAGLDVECEPPLEEASAESGAVSVVYRVVGAAASGVIGDYSAAAVRVILDKISEKLPGAVIELDDE